MTGGLFARVMMNETEREEIKKVVSVMSEVVYAYEKNWVRKRSVLN